MKTNASWKVPQPQKLGTYDHHWVPNYLPVRSIYGIFTYISLIFKVNVGRYTIDDAPSRKASGSLMVFRKMDPSPFEDMESFDKALWKSFLALNNAYAEVITNNGALAL